MSAGGRRRADATAIELVGGAEPLVVGLHRYDERWPEEYLRHRRRILDALAAVEDGGGVGLGVGVGVEHIGSTSVPGLAAKPIIDIVVTVADITAESDYLDPLLAAGYELRVREPGHRLVRTPARDVHVHVYEHGDPAVEAYLVLRDRLRSDAGDRELYASTKAALLERRWDDMNAYAEAKTEVVHAILARGRAAREG